MANIPIERERNGMPWWAWLLGLLLLIGAVWLIAELFDDEPDVDELAGRDDNIGIVDPVEIGGPDALDSDDLAGEPVTVLEDFYVLVPGEPATDATGAVGPTDVTELSGDAGALVGRRVDIASALVLSVVGDSAFFVGAGDDRRVLVVLEDLGESETGAGGSDGRFNVDPGQTVSLRGTVARYEEGARGTWDVPQAERERVLQQGVYIRATSAGDVQLSGGQ